VDVSGRALPGASKFTANVGLDYRYPIVSYGAVRLSLNTAYQSRFNSDTSLSTYAWIPGSSITDIALGFSRLDGRFDAGILVKNALNDGTPLGRTWNSFTPPYSRWIGFVVTGKFF